MQITRERAKRQRDTDIGNPERHGDRESHRGIPKDRCLDLKQSNAQGDKVRGRARGVNQDQGACRVP